MITEKLTAAEYHNWHNYTFSESVAVSALDGQPVEKGFAFIAFDEPGQWSVFSLVCLHNGEHIKTTVRLTDADGGPVTDFRKMDITGIYTASTVGNYPDTAENLRRFVANRKRLSVAQTASPEILAAARLYGRYGGDMRSVAFVLVYPGPLYAFEMQDSFKGHKYLIPELWEEQFESDDLQVIDRQLFDAFLVLGMRF